MLILLTIIKCSVISSYLMGDFPPESQIPSQKNTQNTKNIKKCIEFTPLDMCPPITWSLELTLYHMGRVISLQDAPRSRTQATSALYQMQLGVMLQLPIDFHGRGAWLWGRMMFIWSCGGRTPVTPPPPSNSSTTRHRFNIDMLSLSSLL